MLVLWRMAIVFNHGLKEENTVMLLAVVVLRWGNTRLEILTPVNGVTPISYMVLIAAITMHLKEQLYSTPTVVYQKLKSAMIYARVMVALRLHLFF